MSNAIDLGSFWTGQSPTLTFTFSVDGTLTDAPSPTVTITEGDDIKHVYTVADLTHVSTGVYSLTLLLDSWGDWTATAASGGNGGASQPFAWRVNRDPNVAP